MENKEISENLSIYMYLLILVTLPLLVATKQQDKKSSKCAEPGCVMIIVMRFYSISKQS